MHAAKIGMANVQCMGRDSGPGNLTQKIIAAERGGARSRLGEPLPVAFPGIFIVRCVLL